MEYETLKYDKLNFKARKGKKWDKYILDDVIRPEYYRIPKGIKTALDIGANIGGVSVLMASMGIEVYAYEPYKPNYNLLVENVKLNGFEDKVHCINKGVGNPGIRKLYIYVDALEEENTGMPSVCSQIKRIGDRPKYVMAEIISLDEVLKDIPHCDFMKIDCEGCEYETLMKLTQEQADKIDRISGEAHKFESNDAKLMKHLKQFYKVEKPHMLFFCSK